MRSTPSSLPGPLWPVVVASDSVVYVLFSVGLNFSMKFFLLFEVMYCR